MLDKRKQTQNCADMNKVIDNIQELLSITTTIMTSIYSWILHGKIYKPQAI